MISKVNPFTNSIPAGKSSDKSLNLKLDVLSANRPVKLLSSTDLKLRPLSDVGYFLSSCELVQNCNTMSVE